MLTALVLFASSLSFTLDYATVNYTEPDAHGECSPRLVVRGTGDFSAFEDDGQPLSFVNYRYFLDVDAAPGCYVIPGLQHADACGPDRYYGNGLGLWLIDMDTVSEGEFGTFRIAANAAGSSFDDWDVVAEVPWSCGECSLPADVTGDGVVSIADYLELFTAMGTTVDDDDPRDVNGDGVVDGLDLVEVVTNFGIACPEGL